MTIKVIFACMICIGMTACKSKYRKAADEIASKIGNSVEGMNVGKEKYTVQVPYGWTTEYKEAYGIQYYYLRAPKTVDDPNTNINITTEFMQSLNLHDYLLATVQSIERNIPSARILGQGEVTANGLKGVWYSYDIEPQGVKATLVSYIFPKDSVAYILTAGTQTKDAIKYRRTFDKVAESFKFNQGVEMTQAIKHSHQQ